MHVVLDLDLDFFVSPVAQYREGKGRLSKSYSSASIDGARRFLECCCHLNTSAPIPGRQFACHKDSFKTWRQWICDGILKPPFGVAHVDAHADLGMAGWIYLVSDTLARPVRERSNPRFGKACLNSSNYLLFAVANRWIRQLTYVYPEARGKTSSGMPNDLFDKVFRNEDVTCGEIELKCYSRRAASGLSPNEPEISVEPVVPFSCVQAAEFTTIGFTHMVVAQSRPYTPKSADQLLPVIREYFKAA
jgi:UPF0489 domain